MGDVAVTSTVQLIAIASKLGGVKKQATSKALSSTALPLFTLKELVWGLFGYSTFGGVDAAIPLPKSASEGGVLTFQPCQLALL